MALPCPSPPRRRHEKKASDCRSGAYKRSGGKLRRANNLSMLARTLPRELLVLSDVTSVRTRIPWVTVPCIRHILPRDIRHVVGEYTLLDRKSVV